MAYENWYGLNYAIVYFYNVYGGREMAAGKYSTVVAKFLKLIKDGEKKLPVTSPGTQKRNFTHITDIISGLIMVGEKGQGDGFGLGSDSKYSILELVEMLGAKPHILPPNLGNRLDAELITAKSKELGWECKTDLLPFIKKHLTSVR